MSIRSDFTFQDDGPVRYSARKGLEVLTVAETGRGGGSTRFAEGFSGKVEVSTPYYRRRVAELGRACSPGA